MKREDTLEVETTTNNSTLIQLKLKIGDYSPTDYYAVNTRVIEIWEFDNFQDTFISQLSYLNPDEGELDLTYFESPTFQFLIEPQHISQDGTVNLRFETWSEVKEFDFRISKINEDTYDFVKTYSFNANLEYNPFIEPSSVHSNVENGFGLVSIIADTLITVKLE